MREFVPQPKQDATEYLNRVQEILLCLQDAQLRTLMQCFVDDHDLMRQFSQAPAGTKTHHAYQGGLIEHVTTMLEVSLKSGVYAICAWKCC